MALTVAELNAKLTMDTKDFDRGIGQADKELGGFAKGGLKKFAGAVSGAFAVDAIKDFGLAAVDAASSLNEAMSKSNTIFGTQAQVISQWAKGASKDFGLSERAALDAAGSFGNMFVQLGIGVEEAADMSQGITELAADFASFHNADITQVIDAQSAAFRGEYDSLQRFLPLINAATVEQRALEMTGKKSNKELTAQEKALAVNALMFEGAGQAMGDFDRTADGMANQQRILNAEWENAKAKLGEKLLPVMTQFTSFLIDDGIPAMFKFIDVVGSGMADAAGFFVGALADMVSATGQMLEKVDQFIPGMEGVPERMMETAETLRSWEENLHNVKIGLSETTPEVNAFGTAIRNLPAMPFMVGPDFMGPLGPGMQQAPKGFIGPTKFHDGGVVPGPRGADVPIMAQAGETIIPAGQSAGGGGMVVNINVGGSVITERDLGRVVSDALRDNRLIGVT